MPLGTINLELLNLNAERAYPFTEAATRYDSSQTIQVPNSFLVHLQFSVHAGVDVAAANFFLQTLTLSPTGYTIGIGYDDGSPTGVLAGIAAFAASTHTLNRSYVITGVDDFDDCVGSLAVGILDDIAALPAGSYQFLPGGGQLEPVTIWPLLPGISSVTVVSGSDRSARLTGDIEFVAGTNVRLGLAKIGNLSQISFNAISGEGLNQSCDCTDSDKLSPPIRRINGIVPDNFGNFRMAGESCIQLTPQTNGLTLTNTCATPCCGCTELTALHNQLDKLSDGATTLQTAVSRLASEVSQMSMIVLSSRLGDTGACLTC